MEKGKIGAGVVDGSGSFDRCSCCCYCFCTMKSPTKAKSLPENSKKSTGPAALFAAKKKSDDGARRTESSSPPLPFDDNGESLPKQKKRRSFGIKKVVLSNSLKKNASLEKSMRGHTLAVNNRSLANQVQGLKTQLRIAQEENVEKSRQVNELTARVRRFEVIDDQERFELLLQERLKQELALLGDLVRETVVGLTRSAEKLNSVLTISQRMQASNADQGRSLLVPRPRILLTSPQERTNRLSALFDQTETNMSSSDPTIRKKSAAAFEQRKNSSLQEEMRIEEENEAESADTADILCKSEESPAVANPPAPLAIIDEEADESPFAKKDKVPRTPLGKGPAQSNGREAASPRRKTPSPARPLRPMSPALMQKVYKQPAHNNNDMITSPSANDSDQFVAETPLSCRLSHGDDETLTETVANQSNELVAAPPNDDEDDDDDEEEEQEEELNESSFVSTRSKAKNRRRNISTTDDDEESPDKKRALAFDPSNRAKVASPAKKLRTDRRETFVVSKPAVFVRPPLDESRELSPLSSSILSSRQSPRIGSARRIARSSSADQDDTPKAVSTTPRASPLNLQKSGTPPSPTALKPSLNVVSERESPRLFKQLNAIDEQTSSTAVGQQESVGVFDLSLVSTDGSPQLLVAPVAIKKTSTKPKKKTSKALRSRTPVVDDSPPAKENTLSAKNMNAGQPVVADEERSKTPTGGESSVNSTLTLSIESASQSRSSKNRNRTRTPAPVEDDDTSADDRAKNSEAADGEPTRVRSRRNAVKVTSFKEASLNTKMRRN
uniref:Shugoshin C-terminal domain-containing protein n=1 Tax=Plectus sambesii TaxID=2011161 RepID=A0A914WSM3_9BILA